MGYERSITMRDSILVCAKHNRYTSILSFGGIPRTQEAIDNEVCLDCQREKEDYIAETGIDPDREPDLDGIREDLAEFEPDQPVYNDLT